MATTNAPRAELVSRIWRSNDRTVRQVWPGLAPGMRSEEPRQANVGAPPTITVKVTRQWMLEV